ncbi:type II/IV secretion system protein [Candidatus Falkowbacteria bacterium]|nr:type II/IV secretion system protein [Candidatus Falkowbacteria bacterium]
MPSTDDNKKVKGLSDLLAESKKNKKAAPTIAEEKVAEKFEEKMEEIRIKELEEVAQKESAKSGYPYINLVGFPINSDSLNSIPQAVALEQKVICFEKTDEKIRIASTNPANPKLKDILKPLTEETFTGKGEIYLISDHSFQKSFKLYEKFPPPREFVAGVQITGDELSALKKKIKNFGILNARLNEEKSVTQIIKIMLAGALQADASDVHIEAEENKINIRYRIDGVLHVVATIPKKLWARLDSRVKTIAGLKINVTDKPQDGRITLFMKELGKLDIRVSALPTAYGESIVMRLLSSKVTSLKFEDLGLRGKAYEDLRKQVERPTGMIITTGPTGSGKTTTLYAILNKLNDPETKIITLEDPIEYKLEGISQSQIDHSKGYSFADGLRSILRQDPDIIMVGELRDLETCEVAIQAALTGHEVVSTLHTNDAAGAIPRFLSMGVKSYLLAPSLNAVIGQRLVRKIHDKCKIEAKLEPEQLAKVKEILGKLPPNSGYNVDINKLKFYRGQGCDECNHIGLKGRIGIYEIFTMSPDIEKEILGAKTSEYRMAELAFNQGMITMAQDGLLKALDGITAVDEVFRVAE